MMWREVRDDLGGEPSGPETGSGVPGRQPPMKMPRGSAGKASAKSRTSAVGMWRRNMASTLRIIAWA